MSRLYLPEKSEGIAMDEKKKKVEPICGNCLLYDGDKKQCKVAVLVEGKEYHLPVFPKDRCHMDDLGIEVQQKYKDFYKYKSVHQK